MANAINNANNKWEILVPFSSDAQTVTIEAGGKYVDRDIIVKTAAFNASEISQATLNASATGSATIDSITVGTKTSNSYPVTGSASISGIASANTTASGFATKDSTTGTGSTTGTASLSASIPAAAATIEFTGNATNPTIALDTTASTKSNVLTGTITTTKPSDGSYVSVKATAPKTTLSATTKSVDTAGYLGAASEITATAATTAKTGSVYYVPITEGSLANSATADVTYTENTSVAIPSEGALYINEGYYPATMITLDQMLDGKADTAGVGSNDVASGAVVYDVDGKKITGTMPNATFANLSGSVNGTATMGAPSYNSTSGKFDVTLSGSNSGTVTSKSNTAGFIAANTTAKSGTITGTISGSGELAKIAGSVSISGTKTVKPVIAKATWTPATGVTNAADSAAVSTTAPAANSGVYVAVNTAAKTNNVTADATISTAGYGDATNHGITGSGDIAVGASASDTTYVKIKSGSASITADSIAATVSDPTYNSASKKYDINVSGSKTIGGTATPGWVDSVTGATVSVSGSKELNAAELTHGNTATETKVAVSASGTRSTNLAAPGTDTTYYVTVNASQTAAGSVVHSASVSEGYVPSAGLSQDATIPTSASITGNGEKVYLKSTNITSSILEATTSPTGTNAITYNTPSLTTSAPSAPYIKFTSSANATVGAVYTGVVTDANKYLKIFDGSYIVS